MNPLDYAIIAVYLAGVLLVGLRLSRRMRTGEDFFLAGRLLPWWAIGLSIVVSDIGAKDIVGLAQDSYRNGWVMANWDWTGCIPAMLLAGLVFIPYFWSAGFYTVPEYFGHRYNETVQTISTIVWGLFIAGTIGAIFSASTGVIATLLGPQADGGAALLGEGAEAGAALMGQQAGDGAVLMGRQANETAILIVTAIVVGVYTYSGGLAAVVYTDVVQCIVMIVGMFLVLWFGLQHPAVESWGSLKAGIVAEHPDHFKLFHPPENPSSYTMFSVIFGLGLVLGPSYWIGNQVIVQRVLGARSRKDARRGVLFGAMVKVVFPVLLVFPGILAFPILGGDIVGDEATKRIFPRLVQELIPAGLRGLVFAAMLAGMMGNLSSYLNSAATLWTRDVLRKYVVKGEDLDPAASGRLDLRIGRCLTLIFLVAGAALSLWIDKVFETMQWMLSLFQGPFLALLLFGLFWKGATPAGGLAGIVAGLASAVLLNVFKGSFFGYHDDGVWTAYENPLLHIAWWSFVASVVAVVGVSIGSGAPGERGVRGFRGVGAGGGEDA